MNDNELLLSWIPVAEMETSTEQVALCPAELVAVIVAVPLPTAVTKPEELTVATFWLLEDQLTDLSLALFGPTVALNCEVAP